MISLKIALFIYGFLAKVGSLLSDCSVFVKAPNTSLYEYSCPTKNQLEWIIKKVTRANEGDTWRCLVGFTTIGSEDAYFTIHVLVPIQSVTMTSPTGSEVAVNENTETVIVCTTSGGLPAATVRWYKDQGTTVTSDDIEITSRATSNTGTSGDLIYVTSTLRYSPTKTDTGMQLHCTANNSDVVLTSNRKIRLNVQCSLSCSVKGGNPMATITWDCYNSGSTQVINGTMTTKNVTWTAKRDQDRSCICQSSHPLAGTQSVSVNVETLYPTTVTSFYIGLDSQTSITVNEHDSGVKLTCNVDSKPASVIKITFDGEILKEQSNAKSLSFTRNDVTCLHTGSYTCEGYNGYGQPSKMIATLFVRCSPRSLYQIKRNFTSVLHKDVTLTFNALAYPEPSPAGFSWHKRNDERWTQLLSNNDIFIFSSGLQSNLTIVNVSKTDFGNYRVTVENTIGIFEQLLYLEQDNPTQRNPQTGTIETITQETHTTAIIVGATLGLFSTAVVVYAIYVTILLRRKREATGSIDQFTASTRINLGHMQHPRGNQSGASDGNNEDSVKEDDKNKQYMSLNEYTKDDNTAYDAIQKTSFINPGSKQDQRGYQGDARGGNNDKQYMSLNEDTKDDNSAYDVLK